MSDYDGYAPRPNVEVITLGQRLIDAVGIEAAEDAFYVGREVYALIRTLEENTKKRKFLSSKRKTIYEKSKSIANKADNLAKSIHELLEIYDSPFFWNSLDDGMSHREMLENLELISIKFREDIYRSVHYENSYTGSNVVFAGRTLAAHFERMFAYKASHTTNDIEKTYEGPFVRFARFVFDAAGVPYSDASIARARGLARSEQPYDRWLKETGLDVEIGEN